MPLFSVVVPVYNAGKTIERCVESIVESGGVDVEILLVDDCSRDDSLSKCYALAEKYSQVKVFCNEVNRRVSFTRNHAIDNATGEYLLFVDSDDFVEKEYVPTFKKMINSEALLVCGYSQRDIWQKHRNRIVLWGEEGCEEHHLPSMITKINSKELLQQLWNKAFSTKKVKENNIRFDESISVGEDTRFVLDYIQKNQIEKVCFINQPLYCYMCENKNSLTNQVGYESADEWLINWRKMYEIAGFSKEEIDEKINSQRKHQIWMQAYFIMHNAGMKLKEKKRLIMQLENGEILYKKLRKIYIKEKIARFLRIKK